MPLKFVVTKDSIGRFTFSVMSSNGQVLARSDAYKSRAGAMGGIRSIKAQAEGAEIEDQSTRAFADGRAGAAKAPAPAARKAATARKAPPARKAPAGRKKAAAPAPEPVEEVEEEPEAESAAEPEVAAEPEPATEPEPEPEAAEDEPRPVFAEPDVNPAVGPQRRLVSLRGLQGPPQGRTPRLVSMRNKD